MPGDSSHAEMAAELRTRIEAKLGELAAVLDEGYAAGFLITFGLSFDPERERFMVNPTKIHREF
jgi:hypothetical protein